MIENGNFCEENSLRNIIMEKIVVFDSSILNRDRSCKGRDMNLFVKWASLNLICWHVPEWRLVLECRLVA